MQKVTIVGHRSDRQKVIEKLQQLANVQIIDVHDSEHAMAELKEDRDSELELQQVSSSINFLNRYYKQKKGLIDSFVGTKVAIGVEEYHDAVTSFDFRALHDSTQSIEQRLSEIKAERARLEARQEFLKPWEELDARLEDVSGTDWCEVIAAEAEADDVEGLMQALSDTHSELVRVGEYDGRVSFVLFILKEDQKAQDNLRSYAVNRVSFEGLEGNAKDALRDVERRLSRLAEEEENLTLEAKALIEQYKKLLAVYDELNAREARSGIQANFAHTERVFVIQGWVKAREAASLKTHLEEVSDALAVSFEEPSETDSPPVSLENPKLLEPFEMVTTIYGLPAYNEVDPTPLLAPFFFVFFGLALSDAAYGLLLALVSLYFIKTLNIPWAHKKLFRLLVIVGISTVVFGALLGSWFGNIYELIPGEANPVRRLRDALFIVDPLQEPLTVLGVSLALGIVQVWFGILIKMIADIKRLGAKDPILDQGSWLFFLGAIAFMIVASTGMLPPAAAAFAPRLLIAGALFVMIAAGRHAKSWIAKPFAGLYGLYGLIGYFSDVLSYSRLMALGLATGVIATVVNQMAELVQPLPFIGPVVMLLILAGGHVFNLAINVLGSFIHSGRLQFVEFFTKFFEGGGRAFKPFRREDRYTVVGTH